VCVCVCVCVYVCVCECVYVCVCGGAGDEGTPELDNCLLAHSTSFLTCLGNFGRDLGEVMMLRGNG
jgi:hypothetical protein